MFTLAKALLKFEADGLFDASYRRIRILAPTN